MGNYVGLCILIRFPDVADTISQQEVSNFCNLSGYTGFGNNGSVRDYYYDNSRGKLTYTNVVTQYYTAAHNRSYYTDETISYGTRAQELIVEALNYLKGHGFDFSQLSSDSSGFIYALNVFYVGPTVNNWAKGLWPHSSGLASPFDAGGGKKFSDYQITHMGSELTLRTFCHENGHMVCDFPDLYDYGYESVGVGNYCLMCYGGNDKNPVQICAYLKNEAGWSTTVTSITPGITANLSAVNNEFYVYAKNATEYFIVENRQKTGRDTFLPDAGLAIWHVDEQGSNNNEQMTPSQHYECSLEQADNRFDLEKNRNTGDSEDLFGSPYNTQFSDNTSPGSKWWDGNNSGLNLTQISTPAATMTFVVPAITRVPLYRYWNPRGADHFYTTNWGELGTGRYGWNFEGVQCYVYQNQVAGSVPLYRYWNPSIADHFYTTNWGELGGGRYGWGYEGIQCYVYQSQVSGSVPLYRYWNSGAGDHFYTTNWGELGSGRYGWGYEGIQCYVFQNSIGASTTPDAQISTETSALPEEGDLVPAGFSILGATDDQPPLSFTTSVVTDQPSPSFSIAESAPTQPSTFSISTLKGSTVTGSETGSVQVILRIER